MCEAWRRRREEAGDWLQMGKEDAGKDTWDAGSRLYCSLTGNKQVCWRSADWGGALVTGSAVGSGLWAWLVGVMQCGSWPCSD